MNLISWRRLGNVGVLVYINKKKNELMREKKGSLRIEKKINWILSDELLKKIIKFWRIIECNIVFV